MRINKWGKDKKIIPYKFISPKIDKESKYAGDYIILHLNKKIKTKDINSNKSLRIFFFFFF